MQLGHDSVLAPGLTPLLGALLGDNPPLGEPVE